MDASPRVIVVGGGKMGEAILAGWLRADEGPAASFAPEDFLVVNPGGAKRERLSESYGVACVADVSAVPAVARPKLVLLAVKPQVMMGVLEDMKGLPPFQGGADGPLFVSIAAGLATGKLASALPAGALLVRAMPNTPLQIGQGATAVCGSATADDATVDYVCHLFGSLGVSVAVSEDAMDAVGAISGSGPAYVAAMVEALTAAGASEGLEPGLAETLALQTVLGTAALIDRTGASPEEARLAVCSPGGTTLAALAAMDEAGFRDVFVKGVHAAVIRSKELG